jgi:2-polyprenyl-6-methoxyphenol hydroxylase-like FAD-dependent oxidoreductase
MATPAYDLVTVGGGLGGSALAFAMARRGRRVLVLEREVRFSDRVRGEVLAPWGVAELRALALEDQVRNAAAHDLPWFDLYYLGAMIQHRNVVETTPQASGWLAFYHPAAQEAVIAAAAAAGAEVRRGVRVREVSRGDARFDASPTVSVQVGDAVETITARLVACADGRGSVARKWGGFAVQRETPRHLFSGILLDGLTAPEDTSDLFLDPPGARISLLFPQGRGRVRAYVGYHREGNPPSPAAYSVERFIDESVGAGVPREWYAAARPAGPLAMFDATDNWVDHPYRDGIALIGDAAATSDPTWGQGMSLTLRDARTLADCLSASDDWDAAGHAYAAAHDRYAEVVRTADGWFSDLFMAVGAVADARRLAALPLIAADPTRLVDVPNSGPNLPIDDTTRRRFFGEE